MRTNWPKRTLWIAIAGLALVALIWFAWPAPIAVDLATVTRTPMEVTVDDDGKTRVRHVYTLSAPIAGKVLRISPPRHVGDQVAADETLAVMQPTVPSFHDARTHEELQSALAATEAAVKLAEAEVRRVEAALVFSRSELQRASALARTETISAKAFDKAKLEVDASEAALASAKAQLEVRQHERASVAARLGDQSAQTAASRSSCCIELRTPAAGRILRIVRDSEGTVQPGAPLIDIGDPLDLEVVADLLSTDAVKITEGAAVRIDGWGGAPVRGKVTRIDPAGFLKVSALGIEEQRVRATIDFVDPPQAWSRLGHDYRVVVHVTIWSADDALVVPRGAVFRSGGNWAVYSVKDGRTHLTEIKTGHSNNRMTEVISGLSVGDRIILYPSDRIQEGSRVLERRR